MLFFVDASSAEKQSAFTATTLFYIHIILKHSLHSLRLFMYVAFLLLNVNGLEHYRMYPFIGSAPLLCRKCLQLTR